MAQIKISNLSFTYPGSYDLIFNNINLQLDSNWKLGLIGRNGKGKTTFFKLLMNQFDYHGKIISNVVFKSFPYRVKNSAAFLIDTLKEAQPDVEEWKIKRELNIIGLGDDFHYRLYNTLSLGEQSKAQIAALFAADETFLLIDEPTNHLDIAGRQAIADYLNKKNGFIVISHDRAFLDGCIDHVLALNKSDIVIEKGNFTSFMMNKQYRDQFEIAENKKLEKQIEALTIASQRTSLWSDKVEKTKFGAGPCNRGFIGAKSAKMMQRAKAIEKRHNLAIEQKSKLLKNIERTFPLKFWPLHHRKTVLVEADNAVCYYDRSLHSGVSFQLKQGVRLALLGANGSGKSSLLKAITGNQIDNLRLDGKLKVTSDLIISYVSQDISQLKGSVSAFLEGYSIDLAFFNSLLQKLDFDYEQIGKRIENFSDGQKKKLLIARSLAQPAHLYIWDEPLNHIDIYARLQIEQAIINSAPTMLFVEHDASFVENIATAKIQL